MSITIHEVLVAIDDIRKHTCPSVGVEMTVRGIDEVAAVDTLLHDLQERLIELCGHAAHNDAPKEPPEGVLPTRVFAPDSYLVWCNEHRGWWAPGGWGYTNALLGAGEWTRELALDLCQRSIPKASYLGHLASIPVRSTDVFEFLRGQMAPACIYRGDGGIQT